MMTFETRVKAYRPIWLASGGTQREFNDLVRQAMHAAGQLWIDKCLPRHFEPSAYYRYGYAPRGSKYNQAKRVRPVVKSQAPGTKDAPLKGIPFPNPNFNQTPLPLVWTGQMRELVLSNAKSGYTQPKATATSNNIVVRVPVALGHPINPKNAGEVTRTTPEEYEMLNQKAHGELLRLIRQAGVTVANNAA